MNVIVNDKRKAKQSDNQILVMIDKQRKIAGRARDRERGRLEAKSARKASVES